MAALAFTPRDRLAFGVNADSGPLWDPLTAGFALRRLLLLRQLRAAMERDDIPRVALREPRPFKADMLERLPQALAEHVVSCAQPVTLRGGEFTPCAVCDKCRWRQAQESVSDQASLSSTYKAPVPPSWGGAEQKAST